MKEFRNPGSASTSLLLASLGQKVRFLKPSGNGPRRADIFIDGKRIEFKNPTLNNENTIRNQLLSCLYGKNKDIIKPQSGDVLISNVRNGMTLKEMQESLVRAYTSFQPLTTVEKAHISFVSLLDSRTGILKTYYMK